MDPIKSNDPLLFSLRGGGPQPLPSPHRNVTGRRGPRDAGRPSARLILRPEGEDGERLRTCHLCKHAGVSADRGGERKRLGVRTRRVTVDTVPEFTAWFPTRRRRRRQRPPLAKQKAASGASPVTGGRGETPVAASAGRLGWVEQNRGIESLWLVTVVTY